MSDTLKKLEDNTERRLIVLMQAMGDFVDAVRSERAEYKNLLQIQEKIVKEQNKGGK